MVAQARRAQGAAASKPKAEPVGIGKKLRDAHPWFETQMQKTKDRAVEKRRKAEQKNGPQLDPERVAQLADMLEALQRQINPLENERREILKQLLPHWGHTGIEEIEHPLGKTLVSTSFELCVKPDTLKELVGDTVWQKITERALQAALALEEGDRNTLVRDAIERAAKIKKLKVSVTAPSSRRGKSGAPADGEEEGEE